MWYLLLFSLTVPVTWNPLGYAVWDNMALEGLDFGVRCLCLLFFPGSLEHIWASGWFILVVLNVIFPCTICCMRTEIGKLRPAHSHYKRIGKRVCEWEKEREKNSILALYCPMCSAIRVVSGPSARVVFVCGAVTWSAFPAVLRACWTSPLC